MFTYLVNLHSLLIGARLRDLLRREEGQTLVEYGLIIMLVALAAIAGLTLLGEDVTKFLEEVAGKLVV
jgi:pilus assembly protein Flp/PilA